MANAAALLAEPLAALVPVAVDEALVGDAVVAVLATLATLAMDEEAAARRLKKWVSTGGNEREQIGGVGASRQGDVGGNWIKDGGIGTYGSAAVQYWVTWFWTGGFMLLSGQLL